MQTVTITIAHNFHLIFPMFLFFHMPYASIKCTHQHLSNFKNHFQYYLGYLHNIDNVKRAKKWDKSNDIFRIEKMGILIQ